VTGVSGVAFTFTVGGSLFHAPFPGTNSGASLFNFNLNGEFVVSLLLLYLCSCFAES